MNLHLRVERRRARADRFRLRNSSGAMRASMSIWIMAGTKLADFGGSGSRERPFFRHEFLKWTIGRA